MAMAMSLLGLRVPHIEIRNPGCVAKTFPDFFSVLEKLRPRAIPLTEAVAVAAIDGPAGSGKSTVAQALAVELNLPHFDTGAMYRAVAVAALRRQVDVTDSAAIAELAEAVDIKINERTVVDGIDATDEIRSAEASHLVSVVAANPDVRRILVPRQRQWATELGGGVMEGRDIGTVVFPNSKNKFFLIASPKIRAKRRFLQMKKNNKNISFSQILEDVKIRDKNDESRKTSPLRPAKDAKIIDTSDYSETEVFNKIISLLKL